MIDTAGTLAAAAQAVMEKGARAVYACASHGVLSGPAIERINKSPLTELIITDSIPPRPDVTACPKIKMLTRLAPAGRGGQAHPPGGLDQLVVHLSRAASKHASKRQAGRRGTRHGFRESRTQRFAGRPARAAPAARAPRARSRRCCTAARSSRCRSAWIPLALVRSHGQGTPAQHRVLAGGGRRRRDGNAASVTAMIRDVQIDPLTRTIVHVDFLRVDLDEEVRVTVPLHLKGTPVGVVNGGNLHQSIHEVPIAAKPAAIPVKVEIDVSRLNIGDGGPRQRPEAARGRAGAAGPEDRPGLGGRAAGREGRGGSRSPPPAEGAAAPGPRAPLLRPPGLPLPPLPVARPPPAGARTTRRK